jgi:hypothetical protein
MNIAPKSPKNRSFLSAAHNLSPLFSQKSAYWLGGLCFGLLLLTNFGILGEILAEGFHLLLEIAEEGMDTVLELTGLTPRIAQGVTAYIGFLAALIFGFRLLRKIQSLLQHLNQWYSQFKAETQRIISNMPSNVGRVWLNMHWHKKALLAFIGLAVLAFMVITI